MLFYIFPTVSKSSLNSVWLQINPVIQWVLGLEGLCICQIWTITISSLIIKVQSLFCSFPWDLFILRNLTFSFTAAETHLWMDFTLELNSYIILSWSRLISALCGVIFHFMESTCSIVKGWPSPNNIKRQRLIEWCRWRESDLGGGQ